jgi:hypothetical protein
MTATVAVAAAHQEQRELSAYRDDGPLALLLGRALGRRLPLPPVALALAGAVPLPVAIAIGGDGAETWLAGVLVAWLVLCGGASAGRPHAGALRWAVPPLLRLAEYAALIWIAALDGASALPAAFALLAVLAFRHYDRVYRLRHVRGGGLDWVSTAAGGWDGRVLAAFAALAAGALPAGYYVAAALLGAAFVGDAAVGWIIEGRTERPAGYDDEEDEAQ